ncbi:hypothetical protein HRbin06_00053 [archaeon HR06]|nr:hypothetical protein HRbin06_00053 [archaeon HR06]
MLKVSKINMEISPDIMNAWILLAIALGLLGIVLIVMNLKRE